MQPSWTACGPRPRVGHPCKEILKSGGSLLPRRSHSEAPLRRPFLESTREARRTYAISALWSWPSGGVADGNDLMATLSCFSTLVPAALEPCAPVALGACVCVCVLWWEDRRHRLFLSACSVPGTRLGTGLLISYKPDSIQQGRYCIYIVQTSRSFGNTYPRLCSCGVVERRW